MLLKKTGFPEENEIVICTVSKVQFHSVFVNLDEYRKSGIIHISEISPGRIRNIRDYVKEGKVIVCKVLRVNKERGHIDLSLRRVNENQRRAKINALKQEQIAEKIIEFVAKQHKMEFRDLYMRIMDTLGEDYEAVYPFFEEVVEDNSLIKNLKLDKKMTDTLLELICQRIKPPEVVVEGSLSLVSYAPEGVEDIKKVMAEVKGSIDDIDVRFLGGGKYHIEIKDSNYKDAEKKLKVAVDASEKAMKKVDGTISFHRIEKS